MQITLSQFERIDRLRRAARRDANPRDHRTGQPIRPMLNEAQHQSRLFDAMIDVLGYQAASDLPSLEDYADNLITQALLCQINVVDAEAV